MTKPRRSVWIALFLSGALTGGLRAQDTGVTPVNPNTQLEAGIYATREYLEALLERYENESNVEAYSDVVRQIAKDEAEIIRKRLRDGDFEVGDAITITVPGQQSLTNTFTVAPGLQLIFPELGEPMSLRGVLRSELQDSLRSFFSKFIRNPQVWAQTSIRLYVSGAVGQPGFHDISADLRITDVFEAVGQPSRTADLRKIKILRDNDVIWDGDALQEAIVQGMTIDQLSLRAGDVIEVPEQKQRNIGQMIRDLYFLVPVSFAIMRIF